MEMRGIFAPVVTPFDEKGAIDYDALALHLEFLGNSRLAGVVVMGSNGEFTSLTGHEKVELMAFVRRHLPKEKRLIAGTGTESLRATTLLNERAAEAGADAVLVLNPTYYKGALTPEGLTAWFTAVADSSPLPVMLYNMPGNSSVNIPSVVTCRLSHHPNIAGIKDSSGNIAQITEAICGSASGFAVFAGSGSFLMATLLMGGCGGTLAVANVAPDYCVELMEQTLSGHLERARTMQYHLMALNSAVTSRFGVPGLKAALDEAGSRGGAVRLPFVPLKAPQLEQLREIIRDFEEATGWSLRVSRQKNPQ